MKKGVLAIRLTLVRWNWVCLITLGISQLASGAPSGPGWITQSVKQTQDFISPAPPNLSITNGPIPHSIGTRQAHFVTPEIQALADGLLRDPLRIFNWVRNNIRYSPYFGAKKGAQLTFLERSGNDLDTCALLVALLHAAGYDAP